jgi:hypothetical protein
VWRPGSGLLPRAVFRIRRGKLYGIEEWDGVVYAVIREEERVRLVPVAL